jgi:hypothetical protein
VVRGYGGYGSSQSDELPGRSGRSSGERKGTRLTVNINGEYVLVNSVEEAQALLKAQAHPKERIKRRKRPKVRIIESLRPDIPVSDQIDALGQNIGEVADAAVRNADVVRLFNDAVTQQSIAALGALRMGIEAAQNEPEPVFTPPEVQITPEERQLADGLMRQVGVFDEVLGVFLKGISAVEREAYREMDARMEKMRKRYDALKKVYK